MTIDVKATDWGWRHATRKAWAVRNLSVEIPAGQRVLVLGPSGAGKSTLLAGLAGVLGEADEGEEEGSLRIAGAPPSAQRGATAWMMQDPTSQIVLARVGDDVAFGCENLCIPTEQIWPRVESSLAKVGLDLAWSHPTNELSGGQQQRLVLAGALAMEPGLLILDEPTANLDPDGVIQVRDTVLAGLEGRTLIIVEHHGDIWAPFIDRVLVLTANGLVADGSPHEVFTRMGAELAEMGVWVPQAYLATNTRPRATQSRATGSDPLVHPVLTTKNLSIGYPGKVVRTGLDIDIPEGVSTVITGANGSGKTTLGLTLAGLLAPLEGSIEVAGHLQPPGRGGPHTWKSRELLTRIGFVFQSPEHQFVASTVFNEVAIGLRALKVPPSEIRDRVEELLERVRLAHLGPMNPFSLSGGEKRRLSVATVLASQPAVIILDEPTFGQDRRTWASMVDMVESLRDESCTIISITHDQDYAHALGENKVEL